MASISLNNLWTRPDGPWSSLAWSSQVHTITSSKTTNLSMFWTFPIYFKALRIYNWIVHFASFLILLHVLSGSPSEFFGLPFESLHHDSLAKIFFTLCCHRVKSLWAVEKFNSQTLLFSPPFILLCLLICSPIQALILVVGVLNHHNGSTPQN